MTNVTKQDINKLGSNFDTKLDKLSVNFDKKLGSAVEDLSDIIKDFAFQVDQRFNALEAEVSDIRTSLDRLTNTIDGFVKRIDDYETENTARDAQLARYDRWFEQIADKIGVKLTQ